jgi:hypothetical protein
MAKAGILLIQGAPKVCNLTQAFSKAVATKKEFHVQIRSPGLSVLPVLRKVYWRWLRFGFQGSVVT